MQREPDDGPGGMLRLHLIKKLVRDEVGRVADGLDVVIRNPLAPDGLPDVLPYFLHRISVSQILQSW